MPIQKLSALLRFVCMAFALTVFCGCLCARSLAQTERPIDSFNGDVDGASPNSTLIADGAGNYYGTTFSGGSYAGQPCEFYGCGIIFELSPNGSGGFTETVLYIFTGGADGANPTAGLVFDSHGNLYGTTSTGAIVNSGCDNLGCGTVFEVSPASSGFWTETTLYSFQGGNDGWYSEAPLTFDSAGNLYGTTSLGGPVRACGNGNGFGCGEVFKLTPNGTGGWQYSIVHSFTNGKDGGRPYSGVVVNSAGDIFTTTIQGGNTTCGGGCGTLVEFLPNGGGYTIRLLYAFKGGADGGVPYGGLLLDSSGNIYGTTEVGGHFGGVCKSLKGCGLVFEESPTSGGLFKASLLYVFKGTSDGDAPVSNLTMDSAGNLYGATYGSPAGEAGCFGPCGTIYKLSPSGTGTWNESVVYAFTGGTDGGILGNASGVTLDSSGNIFGTTVEFGIAGGCSPFANGCGVAYEITP